MDILLEENGWLIRVPDGGDGVKANDWRRASRFIHG
jgi:hypothetical protein